MTKPAAYLRLTQDEPEFIAAYEAFASVAHDAGPLSERERRLVKLALAIAGNAEGATHSAVRLAVAAGVGVEDLRHVALLAATTAGFPTCVRAITWIEDIAGTAA